MPVANKFKEYSVEELKNAYQELSQEIFQLTSRLRVERQLEKPHRIRAMKKDRARVLTELSAKEKLMGGPHGAV